MSEFYGYQACEIPDATGAYGINPMGASFNTSGVLDAYAFLRNDGDCAVTDCGLYVGTSSSLGSATKYSLHSSWTKYSYRYFQITGFASNTTHYVWFYATNPAGTKTWTYGSITVPPPYIPVAHSSINASGDWNYFCPNYNFNGLFRPVFTNSSTSTNIDVYGDGNFSHTNASKPNCLATFGTYAAQAQSRQPSCPFSSSTFRVLQTCGNQITGYLKYYISGYSDLIYSHTGQCIQC